MVSMLVSPKVQTPVLADEVIGIEADYEVVLPGTIRVDRCKCYRLLLLGSRAIFIVKIPPPFPLELAAIEISTHRTGDVAGGECDTRIGKRSTHEMGWSPCGTYDLEGFSTYKQTTAPITPVVRAEFAHLAIYVRAQGGAVLPGRSPCLGRPRALATAQCSQSYSLRLIYVAYTTSGTSMCRSTDRVSP